MHVRNFSFTDWGGSFSSVLMARKFGMISRILLVCGLRSESVEAGEAWPPGALVGGPCCEASVPFVTFEGSIEPGWLAAKKSNCSRPGFAEDELDDKLESGTLGAGELAIVVAGSSCAARALTSSITITIGNARSEVLACFRGAIGISRRFLRWMKYLVGEERFAFMVNLTLKRAKRSKVPYYGSYHG